MIAFIKGRVLKIENDAIILDVSNVGYRIYCDITNIRLNEELSLFTYLLVREDEMSLYGFKDNDSYNFFLKLISVKGIGPKIASNILRNRKLNDIISSIEKEDLKYIKSLPGIGAKAAGQIILDLKGKLLLNDNVRVNNDQFADISLALSQLGFKNYEINKVLEQIKDENLSTDAYIKKALVLLNQNK